MKKISSLFCLVIMIIMLKLTISLKNYTISTNLSSTGPYLTVNFIILKNISYDIFIY